MEPAWLKAAGRQNQGQAASRGHNTMAVKFKLVVVMTGYYDWCIILLKIFTSIQSQCNHFHLCKKKKKIPNGKCILKFLPQTWYSYCSSVICSHRSITMWPDDIQLIRSFPWPRCSTNEDVQYGQIMNLQLIASKASCHDTPGTCTFEPLFLFPEDCGSWP